MPNGTDDDGRTVHNLKQRHIARVANEMISSRTKELLLTLQKTRGRLGQKRDAVFDYL